MQEDFQTDNPVPDGTMAFFHDADFANPFDTVVSDEDGNYAATIPVGTVKSRLHTAILKLNEAWNENHSPRTN